MKYNGRKKSKEMIKMYNGVKAKERKKRGKSG